MLLTFGSGTHGCLGHAGYTDVAKAKIVEALLGFTVVRVSCGAAHVMIITGVQTTPLSTSISGRASHEITL